MAKSTVAVKFTGDVASLKGALNDLDGKIGGTDSRVQDFGRKAKVAFAAVGVAAVAGVGFAINAASDLAETVSKSNTVFKDQGATIEAWADKASSAFGQSKQQALAAASSFGNMFVQLGIGSEQAAGMSTKMTELASDFASFHNADITEVLEAQSAAFRGEYDAVQKFVPTINAAAVEQKALAMGLAGSTKELTAQDKALATQALLLEGAGDAAGDFARTSDGLANSQRTMSAQFADLTAKLGTALMPVMASLVDVITTRVIPALAAIGDWISGNKGMVIAALVGIAAGLIAWGVAATATAIANFTLAGSVIAAIAPFIAIGVAVAALAAGVVWAYQNVDVFRNAVKAVAGFLTGTLWPAMQTVAGFITGSLIPAVGRIVSTLLGWGANVAAVAAGILQRIGELVTFFAGLPGRIGSALSSVGSTISGIFTGALNGAKNIVTTAIGAIVGFFKGLPGSVRSAFSTMANAIQSPFTSAFSAIKRLWNSTVGGFGFSVPSWIPGVGGKSFRIPSMHVGGIVPGGPTSESLRLLQGGEGVFTRDQMRALGGLIRGGGGAGQTVIHNVITLDGRVIAEQTRTYLDRIADRNGYAGALAG